MNLIDGLGLAPCPTAKKCCCTVERLAVATSKCFEGTEPIGEHHHGKFGSVFYVKFKLAPVHEPNNIQGDCSFEWWEQGSSAITTWNGKKIHKNTWFNQAGDPDLVGAFKSPSGCKDAPFSGTWKDEPDIDISELHPGAGRVLYMNIIVHSAKECGGDKSLRLIQFLFMGKGGKKHCYFYTNGVIPGAPQYQPIGGWKDA